MTTTNGTMAIKRANTARKIIIGAFLNLAAVANYCLQQQDDVVDRCHQFGTTQDAKDTGAYTNHTYLGTYTNIGPRTITKA